MSARQFSGLRLRVARRAVGQRMQDLGASVGVGKGTVADWENSKSVPPPERLPAIAEAVGRNVDVLFPRLGPPDLADLRADAGHSQTQAANALDTSRLPLSNAELGKRRLAADIAERAAVLYGVTLEELEAAQDVSFGILPSSGVATGQPVLGTVGEKLRALLRTRPVSDEDLAAAINRKAQAAIVTPALIEALRTEEQPAEEILAGLPVETVYEGLAEALDVPPFHFQTGEQVEQDLLARLRFLAQGREGGVTVNARGGGAGISDEMLAVVTDLLVRELGKGDASGQ
ncbi:helix-turn-helix domain-containing protein [Streptomyces noboritoensis]|uniref:Helix-turn-helix domain-containing protein n=1 Tax=Streptomyces noboritoensis TaxID=67337 RepID=A0ABV6TFW2_9ACTN